MINRLLEKMSLKNEEIHHWLLQYETSKELPLYSSVDIRDAGFKLAVVDTNLFPAGFNNLCEHGIEDSVVAVKKAILNRVQGCKNILIIAEEHTRNTFYLENLWSLEKIIERAGFNVKVATFLNIEPAICQDANFVELDTAKGNKLKVYSINKVVSGIEAGGMRPCLIIMNNDLTKGIPEILRDAKTPIYPSIQAGWHSRSKSHHFAHTADLMKEFAEMLDFDPWFFTCFDEVVSDVNINEPSDRERLAETASGLLQKIQKKYNEYKIKEKPLLFLKADSGTYGMGVMPIDDASEVLELNRREKNKLYKGKGSQVIHRYLLQEGVPSYCQVKEQASEVCIYQIDNQFVGGFFRVHDDKSGRDNLNSKGMRFETMCPHNESFLKCGIRTEKNMFDVYHILARIAGIAAHREIIHLEKVVNQ